MPDGSSVAGDGEGNGLPGLWGARLELDASPASGRSAVSCSGLSGGGFGLVAGDLRWEPVGGLTPGGGALIELGSGSTGTGLPGLGGITLAPVLGSSTGGTGSTGASVGRDGGLLYGNPRLVLLPVGVVAALETSAAGAPAGFDLCGTGTVDALFGAWVFGVTILLVALPLCGGSAGAALGAGLADCARVLVLLRSAVATDGCPSATSAGAFGSDGLGSGAAARQGGTTVALAPAGASDAFAAGLETTSLGTWVTRILVLCLLGGGAVGALGTRSTTSASTGADAAASMKWRPVAVSRSRARSGGSSPSESVAGLLIATLTT